MPKKKKKVVQKTKPVEQETIYQAVEMLEKSAHSRNNQFEKIIARLAKEDQ